MGFENFGAVSFTAESKTAEFLDFLEQGKVMTTRCKSCGNYYFPPKMDCPSCEESDIEWVEIPEGGKLLTYTVVHYGPSGFEDDAPYTLGIAEFGGAVRIFGRLSKGIPEDDVKPGIALKVVPVKLPEDRISYEFIKV